jgi:plasmid maintenance system killer protein
MKVNYSPEAILQIEKNALLYKNQKLSKVELQKQNREHHKVQVYEFNKNLDDMFKPEFQILGPLKYKMDRGYDIRINKKQYDPTINYYNENYLKLQKLNMKMNNEQNSMSEKIMKKLHDDDLKEFKYELDNTLPKPKKCKSFEIEIDEFNKYIDMVKPFKIDSLVKQISPRSRRSNKKQISSNFTIISHNNPERQLTPKIKKTTLVNANSELLTITVCLYYKIIYIL